MNECQLETEQDVSIELFPVNDNLLYFEAFDQKDGGHIFFELTKREAAVLGAMLLEVAR